MSRRPTVLIAYDATPPAVGATVSRAADHNGYYNQPFTVTWTGTDAISGIASCSPLVTYSGPDTNTGTLAGTCTDLAGNTSAPVAVNFKYDATPPTGVHGVASRPPDLDGWYNHPVTINFTRSDTTSGVATCTTATYSGPDATGVTVPGSCTDLAGNTATATSAPLNYDHTPPRVTVTNIAGLEVLDVGQPVTGTAADNLSGVLFVGVAFKMAGAAQVGSASSHDHL